ncbi:hypothetical protein [Caldimonas sp. KR1-144]|uniref:hypothetical protein n=1 Tax=Caldimonas sp. KR1-144 TaxID=3400911 RepID=UPI003C0E7035
MPTKPCLVCAEPIQVAATRCPHCQQVQSRLVKFFNTGWAGVLLLVVVTCFGVFFALREPPRWKDHAAEVSVQELGLRVAKQNGRTEMACTALLKNGGHHSWGDLMLEATFIASDGRAIDTASSRARDVVLNANGEARVRVFDNAAWEPADYAKCEIAIKDARLL